MTEEMRKLRKDIDGVLGDVVRQQEIALVGHVFPLPPDDDEDFVEIEKEDPLAGLLELDF